MGLCRCFVEEPLRLSTPLRNSFKTESLLIYGPKESFMLLGIDRFIQEKSLRKIVQGKRVALLCHAASVTQNLQSTPEAIMQLSDVKVTCLFSPQHGLHSEKQDNMIESPHHVHPEYGIQVFSLYSEVRKPTRSMLDSFDILIIDLQDIGARVYTFFTTLVYMMEACATTGKEILILDRPNPAGRPLEGLILSDGWESFVGPTPMVMRHGMTIGELAKWIRKEKGWRFPFDVIPMIGYEPDGPGLGWPPGLAWINPSPNAPNVNMVRCYPGMVLFEGTNLSEGRGTTHPFQMIGAPDIDFTKIIRIARDLCPDWFQGCDLRTCYFEPAFDKHAGALCHGLQIHVDNDRYDHYQFKPFRIALALLKAIRLTRPEYDLWREGPFEYEYQRRAIDLLAGSDYIRNWVDSPNSTIREMEEKLIWHEKQWEAIRIPFLWY